MTPAEELRRLLAYLEKCTASMAHNHGVRTFIVDKEAWFDMRKQILRAITKAEEIE